MTLILPLIHFTAFISGTFLCGFIIYKNHKALLNLVCALLLLTFALWSFGYCFVHFSQTTRQAIYWINVSSIGWILFPFAALYFYLALSHHDRLLKNKFLFIFLVIVSAFFLYAQWSGFMVNEVIRKYWNWSGLWSTTLYSCLFFVYFSVMVMLCIYLSLKRLVTAQTTREKRQALALSITAIISFIFGSTTDIVLPLIGLTMVPQIADIIIMVWEAGIVLSVTRYGLMTLTPVTASNRILSTMTDSLLLLDVDGTIRLANPAALNMLETAEKNLIGTKFYVHVCENESMESFISETLQQGKCLYHEFTCIGCNQKQIPVQISASSIVDNLRTTLGFVIVARDITERKKMEHRIMNLYETEKAQRKELEDEAKARGVFIHILGHELRTPLTPILVSTALLNDLLCEQPDSVQKKLAANIHNSTQVLASRLEELLDLARYSRGTFKLNVARTKTSLFLTEVVLRYKPVLDKLGQQLEVRIPEDLPEVNLDPSRVEQVIVNLLSNASKYGAENGRIILSAGTNDHSLLIEVRDFGIGISAEEQGRLFAVYHRAEQDRQKYPGIGLGLAICKQIVEAHQGQIWVTSESGKGSTFSLRLPINHQE